MDADEAYLIGALCDAHIDFKRNEIQVYQKNLDWLHLIDDILFNIFNVRGTISKRDVFQLRKKSKQMIERIRTLMNEPFDNEHFVAGLFDSEGSLYFSTKSKIPVIDFTQCDLGLENLKIAKKVIERFGIKCYLNEQYIHKHAKRP